MEPTSGINQETISPPKVELPPLPFTYQRVMDPSQASYHERRSPQSLELGKGSRSLTDFDITESVRLKRCAQDWFTRDDFRGSGLPQEQVDVLLDEHPITVYSWDAEHTFTPEHLQKMTQVLEKLSGSFPKVKERFNWIFIQKDQDQSIYGDEEKYPANGEGLRKDKAIRLRPRAMEFFPHRIAAATNFEGMLAHEITHLIDDIFVDEWSAKFQWADCEDFAEAGKIWGKGGMDWELRRTPDGRFKKYFSTKTEEMAPGGKFPLQPEECVSHYAKINAREDVCESMVAYLFDPEMLKRISPDKFAIFEKHDAKKQIVVKAQKVPTEFVRLPEVKPEVVTYFIEEPKSA